MARCRRCAGFEASKLLHHQSRPALIRGCHSGERRTSDFSPDAQLLAMKSLDARLLARACSPQPRPRATQTHSRSTRSASHRQCEARQAIGRSPAARASVPSPDEQSRRKCPPAPRSPRQSAPRSRPLAPRSPRPQNHPRLEWADHPRRPRPAPSGSNGSQGTRWTAKHEKLASAIYRHLAASDSQIDAIGRVNTYTEPC